MRRTTKYVIPRKGEALTWESPGTVFVFACIFDRLKQEIATSRYALLAMTVVFDIFRTDFGAISYQIFTSFRGLALPAKKVRTVMVRTFGYVLI